jgi:glutamine synthetase
MSNETQGLSIGQDAGRGAYILAATCDLNGCFRGKRVEVASLDKILKNGIRMPMSSIGVDIWGTDVFANSLTLDQGDLDGICEPTERGPIPLAWSATQAQFVPMWMRAETGEPFFGDPRRTLADILDRFRAVQLTPVVATEVEFYLIDPKSPRAKPLTQMPVGHADAKDTIYSLEELAEVGPFLDDVYAMAAACGVAVDAATSESGPSQFEFNLVHGPDALRVADDTVFFKQIVRNMARKHGFAATFMAKPYPAHSGSGLHVHFSIVDAQGRNVFDNGGPEGTVLMRQAVAGLIDAMPDCTALFAPHLNSFRRLCPDSLAPTTAAWGYENRTAAIRIPGGPAVARRIEHRVAGIDANPYLVIAAILGAAIDGITRHAEPPMPTAGNTYASDAKSLPATWPSALDLFEQSEIVKRIFQPKLIEMFSTCKRQELAVFNRDISDLEYASYLHSV